MVITEACSLLHLICAIKYGQAGADGNSRNNYVKGSKYMRLPRRRFTGMKADAAANGKAWWLSI